MADQDLDPRVLGAIDEGKRSSLRKMIMGSAFAVPVVASFSMDGLVNAANAQVAPYASNQTR